MIRLLICLLFAAPLAAQYTHPIDGPQAVSIVSGGSLWHVTPTGSMEPTFNETYIIVSKMTPWAEIKVNDIILYESPILDIVICHRVKVRSSAGSIVLCQGDNNSVLDPVFVTEGLYRGTVIAAIPISTIKVFLDERP